MQRVLVVALVLALGSCTAPTRELAGPSRADAPTRVLDLEKLSWPQIAALDRSRTLFVLPVGMVEQHGPHLPVGADTLAVLHEANPIAQRVSRASDAWNVVMMPVIPYGHSGANPLGDQPIHRGEDMAARPRLPDGLPGPIAPVIENVLANEAAFGADLERWLAQRRRL